MGNVGSKGLEVDLQGCTTLGVQSWSMWKWSTLQLFSAHPMQMYVWSCWVAFSTFYSRCPLCSLSTSVCMCPRLHLYLSLIYLFIYLFLHLFDISVHVDLSVFFPFLFSILTLSCFSSLLISLICSPLLDSSLTPLFCFNSEEWLGRLHLDCFYLKQAKWSQSLHKLAAFQISPL